LNHDRTIPSSELFSAIWPFDDETADQKGSLKTMVSRLRARLGEFDKNLSDRIVTDSGGYTWQTDPCCAVDCFDFETGSAAQFPPRKKSASARGR
ncbi:MAG: helix-turn-helix domain-containing protein, partial [Oscillospiraceae bacterium]